MPLKATVAREVLLGESGLGDATQGYSGVRPSKIFPVSGVELTPSKHAHILNRQMHYFFIFTHNK